MWILYLWSRKWCQWRTFDKICVIWSKLYYLWLLHTLATLFRKNYEGSVEWILSVLALNRCRDEECWSQKIFRNCVGQHLDLYLYGISIVFLTTLMGLFLLVAYNWIYIVSSEKLISCMYCLDHLNLLNLEVIW